MKLVFFHDHRLKTYNNEYYTTGGFSDIITNRYTSVFEEMVLVCRAFQSEELTGYTKICNKRVTVNPVNTSILFPNKRIVGHIKNNIKNADRVIVRLPSVMGVYAAIIALKMKKPLLIEVVGSSFGSYWHKSLFGKIVAYPMEMITKLLVRKSKYVLYVSNDYLQKEYYNTENNIGCSDVVLEPRNIATLEKRLKKISSFNKDTKIVLGTLSQIDQRYKGHKTVFKAIAKLKKQGWNIEYRLAGSGKKDYLSSIAKKYKIEENILFCGQIKHEQINDWIDGLDLYLQPSLTEGMPRSVIEALYRGCPTIVSTAGGMYELLPKEFVFKKGKFNSLISLLKGLNSKKLSEMAKRNYDFSSNFEPKKLNSKREKFYQDFKGGGDI